MTNKNKYFSFSNNLSFENLSLLLNDLGIMTHPMSNEQKVCIEYPNINIESKIFNILETKKDNNDDDKNVSSINSINKSLYSEYCLNISKNKIYSINPEKLYKEFNKNISYSIEEFKNSLKIFISIFNCFNDDLFKWDLEDFNLFNNDNKIQILNFNNHYSDRKLDESIEKLYQKHFSVSDYENEEILEIFSNKNSNEINHKTNNDDFIDDFESSFRITANNQNKSEIGIINSYNENNQNMNLFSYEKDKIFRNIYFLFNFFNLMNSFNLTEFNIDNILKNIDLLNSHIINDYKILLIIYFNISIQINLFINKNTINNFLKIGDYNVINDNTNIPNKNINQNDNNEYCKIMNNFIPNIFFIDNLSKEIELEKEEKLLKERILFLNIILKLFNITYFYKNRINIKINIKIYNKYFFQGVKEKLIIHQNIFSNKNNFNKLFNFIKDNEFTELFFSENNIKNSFLLLSVQFILIKDIDINQLKQITKIYYPFIINCDFISFDTLENDSLIKFPLINYINELKILEWSLKFILKISKLYLKKLSFSFIFNSFSIALKKDIEKNDYNINIQDIMIFTGIYHYSENELVEYLSDDEKFHFIYKQYKEILKCCNEYKNYNINVKLFKNGIYNKELQYYFIIIFLNLLNNNNINSNECFKKIVLCDNNFINPSKYFFLHIKPNIIQNEKNKDKLIQLKNVIGNNKAEIKENNSISPKKKRKISNKFLGGLNLFNKNKRKTKEEEDKNSYNIFNSLIKEKENKNDSTKKINQQINNFFKKISSCSYISNLEANIIINFIKEIKNYFSDFLFYVEKSKNEQPMLNDIKFYIYEKSFCDFISLEPITILRHFTNNKCIIILKDYFNVDLYLYLYDFYDNKLEKNSRDKSKMDIFNEIIQNINNFKEACSKIFISKKSSISIGKISFIVHKNFIISNQYFNNNKFFFNEENRIIILDKFTHTDCIFDNNHITIVLKNNFENEKKINTKEDNFIQFYSTFFNEYDIIKYIMDKKLMKFNKIDIIVKRKILQINNGQIQLKKIDIYKNHHLQNIKIDSKNDKNDGFLEIKEGRIINEEINNRENYLIDNSNDYIENYNLFRIKDLFKYENSYPLIIFFLQNESEISNLSFLLFSFNEIILSKLTSELTKEFLIKKIITFFYRFRNSKFIPIIFNKKYFLYFLNCFESIINKIKKNTSNNVAESLKIQNEINQNKYIFENIIFFPIKNKDIFYNISNDLLENGIFINLTKNISIFKIEKEISYNINQVCKMFKFHRILDTISELGKISIINIDDKNNNIIIYKITKENLNILIRKNLKKVKFIGINKENKTTSIHLFNSNDILIKFKDENNINNNCLIY